MEKSLTTLVKKHDCPCCRKCTLDNHNTCKDNICLVDVIQNAKASSAFPEIKHASFKYQENKRWPDHQFTRSCIEKENNYKPNQKHEKRLIEHLDDLKDTILKDLNNKEIGRQQSLSELGIRRLFQYLTYKLDHLQEHTICLHSFLAQQWNKINFYVLV